MRIINFFLIVFFTGMLSIGFSQTKQTLKLEKGENFQFIDIKDIGTLFLTSEKKKATLYFINKDRSKNFKHTISEDFGYGQDFYIKVLSHGDHFYILHDEGKSKKLHAIKANEGGVVKKMSYSFKEHIDETFINDGNLVVFFYHKKDYFVRNIDLETLKQVSETPLELREVEEGKYSYIGTINNLIVMGGFVLPDDENKLKHKGLYISYLNREGKVIKERILEITPETGKTFIPTYHYRRGGSQGVTMQGPAFRIYNCPYTADIFIYTYYIKGKGMVWNREGVYVQRLRLDPEEEVVEYEKYIPFKKGTQKGAFLEPDFVVLEGEYPVMVYEEKVGSKFHGVATILDKEGNILLNEMQTENRKSALQVSLKYGVLPPNIYLIGGNYFESFGEIILSSKNLKDIPDLQAAASQVKVQPKSKKLYGAIKNDGKWQFIEYDEDSGVVSFH